MDKAGQSIDFLLSRRRDVNAGKALLRKARKGQRVPTKVRRIKQRLRPMVGLKSFETAKVVIVGIELVERIRKGQFKMGKLGGPKATMPEIWQVALASF